MTRAAAVVDPPTPPPSEPSPGLAGPPAPTVSATAPGVAPVVEPAAVPVPSPSTRARAEHERSTLAEEATLLARARISLSNGDPRAALDALEHHRASFPAGELVVERERLGLRAACDLGDPALARAAATRVAEATATVVPRDPCATIP